jgi:hypothetical protein
MLEIGDHFFLNLRSNASHLLTKELFGPVIQFCLSFKQQYVFSMDIANETDGKDAYRKSETQNSCKKSTKEKYTIENARAELFRIEFRYL